MPIDEEITRIVGEVALNPEKIFNYKDDIQTFDRILQILFNTSKLGTAVDKIRRIANFSEDENINISSEDLHLLYDIAYKYIPRKMDKLVSDERIAQTSEKTLQRLIKSQYNRYYNDLEPVPSIISKRFDQYPWQTYNRETLSSLYINSKDVDIFKKIYPLLDKESVETCFNNTEDNLSKCAIVDYIIEHNDSEEYKNIINSLGEMFVRDPMYLKYYNGDLDKYALIIIIGKSMKSDNYEEIKQLLLQKNISEEMIKNIENLFKMNYNHDLDSEIIFDD